MNRFCLALAAAILTIGVLAGTASAAEFELGSTTTPVTSPVCPAGLPATECAIVLTQVTAMETVRDGVDYPTTVKTAGELVAFTVGISGISTDSKTFKKDVSYLNSRFGGPPEAALTVLRPLGPRSSFRWAVAAESLPFQLLPYVGEVAQFPLVQPLPVVPGEVIGVTVPTWAPVLSIDLTPTKFAYRQSRSTTCTSLSANVLAQLTIGESAGYGCNYTGTRIEYSATEITAPTPTR